MLRTRVTELFEIAYPIISAPMSGHSGGGLAAAVSRAGGLGSFGATDQRGPDWVRAQISAIREETDRPFAVGYITPFMAFMEDNFRVALEEHVPAVMFSFSDPQPWLGMAKEAGAITICQVQSMELAEQATDAGTDVLVKGKWTATWFPHWLRKAWLVFTCRIHARLLIKSFRAAEPS